VSYHKSKETKELLKEAGVSLKFQPAYSPDLNPIEPSWDTTKNDIRGLSGQERSEGRCNERISFLDKLCSILNFRTWSDN